jgi:two-component system phosphate regulon sensor histidine kinase PhoR
LSVDGEGHLRYLNNAALQLFGVRVEDVLGAAFAGSLCLRSDWNPPCARRCKKASARRAKWGFTGRRRVLRAMVRTPRTCLASVKFCCVWRRCGVATAMSRAQVAILQDLTEMRRLERVRREFVANASHELRTPIANIRAGAETILSNPQDPALAERFLPHLVTESGTSVAPRDRPVGSGAR